ncbi:hypothetical protein KIN20_032996 [Parelaphostrongylus tenuis]|uniref:Uncharacterized protein n=1 Tax=Parelaphostrongylus tenuis TaxID=148309 RepID=A0AAD5R9M3_PARTN|nr:hypothetical protein KIN20_032996 [Parelaphostrongylus tenuis]
MGNNQPTGFNKRDRSGEGGMTTPGRSRAFTGNQQGSSNPEDGCPVQVKIAKNDDDMERQCGADCAVQGIKRVSGGFQMALLCD